MKAFCFFFFVLFIAQAQHTPNPSRTSRKLFDIFGMHKVFIPLSTSEGLSGATGFYQDFFNNVSAFYSYDFDAPFNLTMKKLNQQYKIFNDDATYHIESIKLYMQYANVLRRDLVLMEMEAARGHPDHTPSLVNYLIYDKFAKPVPPDQEVKIYHQLVEVCLKNDKDDQSHHFLVDRVSKGKIPFQMWNSVVRINYLGKGDGCALNSKQWADFRDGLCNAGGNIMLPCIYARASKTGLKVKMDKLLRLAEIFLLKYKVFNTLYNCDHFATNAYDIIANEHEDFQNWEIMGEHSSFSNKQPQIDFIDPNELKEFD